MATDVDQTGLEEHGDFVVGPVLSQEELLRRKSQLHDNGTLIGEEREDAAEEEEEDRLEENREALEGEWDDYTTELIDDDSDYRTMMEPGSRFNYCFEAASPEEKQEYEDLHEIAIQAENAVDDSAKTSTDGKPAAETVVDARIAKTDEAIKGTDIVVKNGTPADAAIAAKNGQTLRQKREYDRETQRLIREAHTKDEKMEILKKRSPDLYAEVQKKAAIELARRNGTQPDVTTQSGTGTPTATASTTTVITPANPASNSTGAVVSPVVTAAQVVTTPQSDAIKIVAPTTDFNAAAKDPAAPAPTPTLAQQAGALFTENRKLFDISENDNLDDPDSKYNSSLWYAYEKKPDLLKTYDDAVDKQQAACDAADATVSADNFLASRQAIIDRKLAVNDIAAFDYTGHGKTEEANQAQAERTKLLDEQKKLADLKTQMEGKTEAEKGEMLRAAFPPDTKSGETVGIYDKYTGQKPDDPKATATNDPDCCSEEGDYLNDWVLSGAWYDTGSACSIYDLPGGVQAPACSLTPAFTAVASAQPLTTDSKAEVAPLTTTTTVKPPVAVA